MNIEQALEHLGITPGKVPVPVSLLTEVLNLQSDTYTHSTKGVGRYLKANGFMRTVRVINGTHSVCYFCNEYL
jgi:hypothetical protein